MTVPGIFDKYLDLAVSIFVYVASAVMTASLLVFAHQPIILQGSDKTFIESTGIQGSYESEDYGRDLLLMLLNTDSMTPYPKAIRINNTPVIKLDNDFVAFQMERIASIYSASGAYRLSAMLDYKIVSKEFIHSGPDSPYIQYTLQEVRP